MKREIYSVVGPTPEITAYSLAKYSRSSMSLKESIKELSQQKAEQFLNTFYFQYGHSSIADLAHIVLAIENISILSALYIVDESLWDGQERSTRYQDFNKTKYYLPKNRITDFESIADQMFVNYNQLTNIIVTALEQKYEKPSTMTNEAYLRTLRARAFDVSRYWLPLCTNTSLGQITNARTLEKQLSRLLSSEIEEIIDIALEMKEAVVTKEPVQFSEKKMGPLLPTLAKYINRNEYLINYKNELKVIAKELFTGMESNHQYGVEFFTLQDPLIHACSSLLYSVTNYSYGQIKNVVEKLSIREMEEILSLALQSRGKHDTWLKELQMQPLIFDITMDIGSFRDLNRHRKVNKILQELKLETGYNVPSILHELDLSDKYKLSMENHYSNLQTLNSKNANSNVQYLMPLGANCRSLHQMDFHQAAYLIELRTGSAGHFSYREIAYQMYEKIAENYPTFSSYIRSTNPRVIYDPFQR